MSGSLPREGGANGVHQLLRAHRRLAVALPHPDEAWLREEAPEIIADHTEKLLANHIIEVDERFAQGEVHRYRTRRPAYAAAQDIDPPRLTPCGHTGVRNLGDGVFTCSEPDCSRRFDRETAREVLGG